MNKQPGVLTLSLDFELFWGVRDRRTIGQYGRHLKGVWDAVPRLLDLFRQYGVHCSWATVGLLFGSSKSDVLPYLPARTPEYDQPHLSPYPYLMGSDDMDPIYHFAQDLIRQIGAVPGQEISTHTFSHFYTLEKGATPATFEADLKAALQIAHAYGWPLQTIIFPRNQYSAPYLDICRKHGIIGYRGTEQHWLYTTRSRSEEQKIRRGGRLLDTYLNLSGHHTFPIPSQPDDSGLFNIPASRFLRPFSPKLKSLEFLRVRRITGAMRAAARSGTVFHLWWHPHNFGIHLNENLRFLETILKYYRQLQQEGRMVSLNMLELCQNKTA